MRPSGRTYDEFDHDAFRELYVRRTADGLAAVELYLEGVHCASCVWLVERVPLMLPGVVRAELQLRRSLARVEWDAAAIPLLTDLCETMKDGSLCALGGFTPFPVMSALTHFPDDFATLQEAAE